MHPNKYNDIKEVILGGTPEVKAMYAKESEADYNEVAKAIAFEKAECRKKEIAKIL